MWRFDDKAFLQSCFSVCCFIVETETLVKHGLGTRYTDPFDVDAAVVNAVEVRTFTNRYSKKVKAALQKKKSKAKKAEKKRWPKKKKRPGKKNRGVSKKTPRAKKKIAVAPKGKSILIVIALK